MQISTVWVVWSFWNSREFWSLLEFPGDFWSPLWPWDYSHFLEPFQWKCSNGFSGAADGSWGSFQGFFDISSSLHYQDNLELCRTFQGFLFQTFCPRFPWLGWRIGTSMGSKASWCHSWGELDFHPGFSCWDLPLDVFGIFVTPYSFVLSCNLRMKC